MPEFDPSFNPYKIAGENLRKLIKKHYRTQEEFAFQYGTDVRTVRRYIKELKHNVINELAMHFNVHFLDFFKED